jgi:hypothetical protein
VTEPRRFPPPWSVDDPDRKLGQTCYIVHDANGHALAYVYFEDEPGRRSAAHLMTRDKARRIAVNIAKLPELIHEPQEREPDDEGRTTSLGLFNAAEAYRHSAMSLHDRRLKIGHAESPVRLLYFHALELYLKALVRQKHTAETLKRRFRHNIENLLKESETLGLAVANQEREVLTMIAESNAVIDARYIRTGFKVLPTLEALNLTCDRIRQGVGRKLRENGVGVRL